MFEDVFGCRGCGDQKITAQNSIGFFDMFHEQMLFSFLQAVIIVRRKHTVQLL